MLYHMVKKTVRKRKQKKNNKRIINKFKLLKLACKNFGKPIYLMRHLNTDANIISDSVIGRTYNKLRGKTGGSLSHYLPYVPIHKEPTITAWGRKDVISLPKKYGVRRVKNNHYTVIVSPLLRTWISALLFIRALMKNKEFTLTLIISPVIEKQGFTGNTPIKHSYQRFFKEEVKENEEVTIKFCDNINRKSYTCTLKDVVIEGATTKQILITDLYSIVNKNKHYKPFTKGGMLIDETLYMISNSCRDELKSMKEILIYSHNGCIRNYLFSLGYSKDKVMKLKGVNGYAVVITLHNNKVNIQIKLPKGRNLILQ